MPLMKTKPFALSEPPKDVKPHQLVYQVRFTNEIFTNYSEYLKRLNLYRQKVWKCKVTGKVNLTYEEALVSEKHAAEKVQEFPKELTALALGIIQFSMLSLKELARIVSSKLQEHLYVGAEVHGKKDGDVFPCKIVKILEDCAEKVQYEVVWLDRNNDTKESDIVNEDDLVQKKFPYSRNVLKSFIRESTYRHAPWVIHAELATKHGISTDPPEELRDIVSFENGLVVRNRKRRTKEENTDKEDDQASEPIKYPIDDLLVQPGADDPVFTERPSPSRDFNVPMDCVGDLLAVWDFCSSFGRLLHLWPYSLEDFEKAIFHKDTNLVLIVETHMVLLQLLINDDGEYFSTLKERKRKLKVTLMKWTEYVCDFIDMINIPELSTYLPTIKRGHYGLLDPHAKLRILSELVDQALETDLVRRKLDESIEKRLVLAATTREEALEEGRKRREEKERLKTKSVSATDNHCGQNGYVAKEQSDGDKNHMDTASNKKKQKTENMMQLVEDQFLKGIEDEETKQLNGDNDEVPEQLNGDCKEAQKPLRDGKVEARGKSSKERREHYEREMEKLFVRTNPLGKDRHYNRYWWFRHGGRIFVESPDSKQWGFYSTKEELDALMGSLNCKGEREKALHGQLEKFYRRICSEIQKRSKESAREIEMEDGILRRSTRVRASPRDNPANAFMRYLNKWKEN